jgi:hypothetical protein
MTRFPQVQGSKWLHSDLLPPSSDTNVCYRRVPLLQAVMAGWPFLHLIQLRPEQDGWWLWRPSNCRKAPAAVKLSDQTNWHLGDQQLDVVTKLHSSGRPARRQTSQSGCTASSQFLPDPRWYTVEHRPPYRIDPLYRQEVWQYGSIVWQRAVSSPSAWLHCGAVAHISAGQLGWTVAHRSAGQLGSAVPQKSAKIHVMLPSNTLQLRIRKVPISNLCPKTDTPTEIFRGFPQLLQQNWEFALN